MRTAAAEILRVLRSGRRWMTTTDVLSCGVYTTTFSRRIYELKQAGLIDVGPCSWDGSRKEYRATKEDL
jgi:hypothetical protein